MKRVIPGTLKRFAAKIADVDRDPDGWSVGLAPGWFCEETETHAIFENTLEQIAARFASVVPCNCEECERLKATK